MILQPFNFFRSGSSHRLRIALNLKGVSCDDHAAQDNGVSDLKIPPGRF